MLRFLFALAVLQSSLTCAISQDSPRNCRERYRKELDTNPKSSSAHFLLGTRNLLEIFGAAESDVGTALGWTSPTPIRAGEVLSLICPRTAA